MHLFPLQILQEYRGAFLVTVLATGKRAKVTYSELRPPLPLLLFKVSEKCKSLHEKKLQTIIGKGKQFGFKVPFCGATDRKWKLR